ncbi:MAG: hypothetical protein EBZ77_05095 [Chitinophagia bacterium]|nr:hypothetical protein [Chitinophagia bacterium]
MKKILFFAGLVALAFTSCKETPPPISFSDTKAEDTTYIVSPVPAAEPHNVLFEDFTGPKCPNCPGAKRNGLDPQIAANPGRINVIAYHIFNFPQAAPVEGAKYDFRDSVGTDLIKNIYRALWVMPSGGIDRMPFGNDLQGSKYQVPGAGWASAITTQLNVNDSINLDLSCSYNATSGVASIETKVTYLYAMNTVQNLSIAIVEDSLIDIQEDAVNGVTTIDSEYHFEDIFRAAVTSVPYGDAVLSAKVLPTYPAKEAGRVYIRRYSFPMKSTWNAKYCKVVAYVHKGGAEGGVVVLQSKQVKVQP